MSRATYTQQGVIDALLKDIVHTRTNAPKTTKFYVTLPVYVPLEDRDKIAEVLVQIGADVCWDSQPRTVIAGAVSQTKKIGEMVIVRLS